MRIRDRWWVFILVGIGWLVATTAIGLVLVSFVVTDYRGSAAAWPEQAIATLIQSIGDDETWLLVAVNLPILVATQLIFLLPVFRFNPETGGRKSLRLSMVVAGFGAAMLTTGMLLGLVTLVQWITGTLDAFPLTLYIDTEGALFGDVLVHGRFVWLLVVSIVFLLASWVFWSILLIFFIRRRNTPEAMRRITGLLFAGTVLEVLLVLPLEVMVRRRTECYCATGSFQMLLGAVAAATWLLGPGLLLLLVLRRPAYWGRYCPVCGHAKGPRATQPSNCPECGRAWVTGEGPAG